MANIENNMKGNQYALTMICMLNNYVICIPIPDKSADTVANVYLKEVYCRFGGSTKIIEGPLKIHCFLK